MNKEIISIIVTALIKHGPSLAKAILDIFSKENVTKEDFDALFDKYQKTYEEKMSE